MADQQQDKSQGQQGNGGSWQDRARDAGQRVRETGSRLGESMHHGYDTAREQAMHRYRQTEGMIARNPVSSVMLGFGVGLGLGVLLSVLLTPRGASREHSMTDAWRDRLRGMTDSMSHSADYMKGSAKRLRDLPGAVARHMPHR